MQSAKRFALAEMSPDNNPFLLTPPRVIKCVTKLFGYILDKVYLNNGKDNKVVEYKPWVEILWQEICPYDNSDTYYFIPYFSKRVKAIIL